eukprot:13638376-Heterocapsa_arctica.AAC.1
MRSATRAGHCLCQDVGSVLQARNALDRQRAVADLVLQPELADVHVSHSAKTSTLLAVGSARAVGPKPQNRSPLHLLQDAHDQLSFDCSG